MNAVENQVRELVAVELESAKRRNLNKLGNEAYSEQRAIARKEAQP